MDVSALWFLTVVENLGCNYHKAVVCLPAVPCILSILCAGARLATMETLSWDQATTAAPALALMALRVDASLPVAVTRTRSHCKSCVSVAQDT